MHSGTPPDALHRQCCQQTTAYRHSVNNKITEARMPARHEKLHEFDGACEDHKEDGKRTALAFIAETECQAGCPINCEMLKAMGHAGFGPQTGRNHRQNDDTYS